MRVSRVWKGVALCLGVILPGLFLGAGPAAAEGGEKKKESRPVIDEAQVYYGKACTCKAPAVVDAARIYKAIPEYKKILDQGLTSQDAEYTLLLVKATRKFRAAVEGAAVGASRDLVGNVGSVKWEGHEIPDLTDATLKKLDEQSRGV